MYPRSNAAGRDGSSAKCWLKFWRTALVVAEIAVLPTGEIEHRTARILVLHAVHESPPHPSHLAFLVALVAIFTELVGLRRPRIDDLELGEHENDVSGVGA